MTQIELTSPACLLLGMVALDGRMCQLGITLKYPPIQLLARPAPELAVTGGRADLARQQAERFFQRYGLPPQAEVEIELAIPSFMGLGSAGMLGLSIARALAALHGLPAEDATALARAAGLDQDQAIETRAFAQGGLLLVDDAGALRKRAALAHADEADDWVFVLLLPRVPAGTPAALEADRRRELRAAAQHLDAASGRICLDQLWPAAERDDIGAFAQALAAIQAADTIALERAGHAPEISADERAILDLMRDGGALACGRAPAGLGLYGLIRGGRPSRELRRAIAERVGIFGGTVMASICDNDGARQQIKQ